MTPRMRRRLGLVLVGIASMLAVLQVTAASGSPISDKQAQAQRLVAEIQRQGDRVSVLDEQYNQAQLDLAKVEQAEARAQDQEQRTMQRFQAVLVRVRQRAVVSYMQGGGLSRMAQLVGSNGD